MPEIEDKSATLRDLMAGTRVIPVVTIERAEQAVPLARALTAGGLRLIEVTLRTPAALDALGEIAAALPEAVVGVGTLRDPKQLGAARAAGARFGVSPGHTPELLEAAETAGLPFLPGVATASEAMALAGRGYSLFKLFPAEALGGVATLRALAGPLPELAFCPSGGIGQANLSAYLACPNVACVGGSWIAPPELLEAGDWAEIEARARAAAAAGARGTAS